MATTDLGELSRPYVLSVYSIAKSAVVSAGYGLEVTRHAATDASKLSEAALLSEHAWVVLSAGLSNRAVVACFPGIADAFMQWRSAAEIVARAEECRRRGLSCFNHPRKVAAMVTAACMVVDVGFDSIRRRLLDAPFRTLRSFPYIGEVTVFHLAKNLGIETAKPDRHLSRMARILGYSDAHELCSEIAEVSGDSVRVVDLVLWRFATLRPHYPELLA